jgi:hypothetical protein
MSLPTELNSHLRNVLKVGFEKSVLVSKVIAWIVLKLLILSINMHVTFDVPKWNACVCGMLFLVQKFTKRMGLLQKFLKFLNLWLVDLAK